jgi:hypothetical protein
MIVATQREEKFLDLIIKLRDEGKINKWDEIRITEWLSRRINKRKIKLLKIKEEEKRKEREYKDQVRFAIKRVMEQVRIELTENSHEKQR